MAEPEFRSGDKVKIVIDWSDAGGTFVPANTIGTVQLYSASRNDPLAIRYTVNFPTPTGSLQYVPEEYLELHKRAGR